MPARPWIDAAALLARLGDADGEDLPERFASAVPAPTPDDGAAEPDRVRLGGDVALAAAAADRYTGWMLAITERDARWFDAHFAPDLVVRNPANGQVHDRAAMIALELRIPPLETQTHWVAAATVGDVTVSAWRVSVRQRGATNAAWTEARFGSTWEAAPPSRLLRHVRLVDAD